jgi:L,D-transpeptidase YcbB
MKKKSFFPLITICWLLPFHLSSQPLQQKLAQFINSSAFATVSLQFRHEVKTVYEKNGYKYCWLTGQLDPSLNSLRAFITETPALGLKPEDYQPAVFSRYQHASNAPVSERDSIMAELQYTDAALHFMHDVLTGNAAEQLSYNGQSYTPNCYDLPGLLHIYLTNGRFAHFLTDFEPKDPAYQAVKEQLNQFRLVMLSPNFTDTRITQTKVSRSNKSLLSRLYQLGFLESENQLLSDAQLKEKLKQAQNLFNLLSDGVLRKTTLEAVHVPLRVRVRELATTLNTLRWLQCIKQSKHIIVVNIPSANLLLYEHETLVLESRIIAGKKSTPTPTLSSTITEVILYPYWHVPYKIATQELLPRIKQDRGYLEAHQYQVLNGAGKVMNPAQINWRALSSRNFPYTIRQSTGCDNALGIIKLNFYNPFSVYLHDTPTKSLFAMNRRFFSHGCMRVEKAMEIGHYILKENSRAIDTLEEKGCINNQAPVIVPAEEKIPVFVLYHTAWIDAAGKVSFHEDVYDRLRGTNR